MHKSLSSEILLYKQEVYIIRDLWVALNNLFSDKVEMKKIQSKDSYRRERVGKITVERISKNVITESMIYWKHCCAMPLVWLRRSFCLCTHQSVTEVLVFVTRSCNVQTNCLIGM